MCSHRLAFQLATTPTLHFTPVLTGCRGSSSFEAGQQGPQAALGQVGLWRGGGRRGR